MRTADLTGAEFLADSGHIRSPDLHAKVTSPPLLQSLKAVGFSWGPQSSWQIEACAVFVQSGTSRT